MALITCIKKHKYIWHASHLYVETHSIHTHSHTWKRDVKYLTIYEQCKVELPIENLNQKNFNQSHSYAQIRQCWKRIFSVESVMRGIIHKCDVLYNFFWYISNNKYNRQHQYKTTFILTKLWISLYTWTVYIETFYEWMRNGFFGVYLENRLILRKLALNWRLRKKANIVVWIPYFPSDHTSFNVRVVFLIIQFVLF